MRKTLFAAAACATVLWTGCSKSESVTVTIANPLAIERTGEMVEIPVNDIYTQLNLSDTAQFVIYDEKAQEVPYQLTYDEKVIFPSASPTGFSNNCVVVCTEAGNTAPTYTIPLPASAFVVGSA